MVCSSLAGDQVPKKQANQRCAQKAEPQDWLGITEGEDMVARLRMRLIYSTFLLPTVDNLASWKRGKDGGMPQFSVP